MCERAGIKYIGGGVGSQGNSEERGHVMGKW